MIRLVLPALTLLALIAPARSQESIQLFNGRDLSGWDAVLDDPTGGPVWSVKDGILHCTGRPAGYIRTEKGDHRDYVLTVEWRWPEGSEGGNNGVLVHTSTARALGIWPKSVECQLASGNAGDFWVIGTTLEVPNPEGRVRDRRHLNLTDDSEKPIGDWNTMEITCKGDTITVKVNGDLVNEATNCSVSEGAISLQSEGAPIEFRKVEIKPIAE